MNKIKCEDEYELHEIENQYIKFYDPLLNSMRSEPEEEYKNEDLIDINIIANRKNFPHIKYMCKCGLEYTRTNIDKHNKKDQHQLYILKLNVIHLEQKIFYKNKNYEIIKDDHEIIEKCKKDSYKIAEKYNSKIFYCEICNKEMKISSRWNHIKYSKEHKKNMEKSNK